MEGSEAFSDEINIGWPSAGRPDYRGGEGLWQQSGLQLFRGCSEWFWPRDVEIPEERSTLYGDESVTESRVLTSMARDSVRVKPELFQLRCSVFSIIYSGLQRPHIPRRPTKVSLFDGFAEPNMYSWVPQTPTSFLCSAVDLPFVFNVQTLAETVVVEGGCHKGLHSRTTTARGCYLPIRNLCLPRPSAVE